MSFFGRFELPTISLANLVAGGYRVPSLLSFAVLSALFSRVRSAVGSVPATGSFAKNTTVARSEGPIAFTISRALSSAVVQRLPYPMLYDRSTRITTSRAPDDPAPRCFDRSNHG